MSHSLKSTDWGQRQLLRDLVRAVRENDGPVFAADLSPRPAVERRLARLRSAHLVERIEGPHRPDLLISPSLWDVTPEGLAVIEAAGTDPRPAPSPLTIDQVGVLVALGSLLEARADPNVWVTASAVADRVRAGGETPSTHTVGIRLAGMVQRGLVTKREGVARSPATWSLTPAGDDERERLLLAERQIVH